MTDLKCKKRDINSKGKQLRRQGIIPAVLYGKHLDESVILEIPEADVDQFLRHNAVGSTLNVVVGRKKYLALLKDYSTIPLTTKTEHLSFQALVATEQVMSSARIILHNRENIEGLIQQSLDEISFKALPADLVDRIDVDIVDMVIGDVITVEDLPIAKNEAIEILTPLDTTIVSVVQPQEFVEPETDAVDEEEDAVIDATEEETEDEPEVQESAE